MTILSRHHKFNSKMKFEIFEVKFEKLSFSKVFTKFIFPQGITRLHNCVKFIFGGQFNPVPYHCSYPNLNKLYFCWWNVPTFQPRPGNLFHGIFFQTKKKNWKINPNSYLSFEFRPIRCSVGCVLQWSVGAILVIGFVHPHKIFVKIFFSTFKNFLFVSVFFSLCEL